MSTTERKALPLSKSLQQRVSFANFCTRENFDPLTLGQLMAAVERSARAWERSTQDAATSHRHNRACDKWRQIAEGLAVCLGCTLDWPGLYAVLNKSGRDIYLPY